MGIHRPYIFFGLFSALILAGGCSSKHPVATLPPSHGAPPKIAATAVDPPHSASQAEPGRSNTIPAPETKPDPDADLILEVEKEYQAGQKNQLAENFNAAKANFDRALTLLSKSAPDPGSGQRFGDQRLQQEFDKVKTAIGEMELQTSKETETAPEQKSEPAPIDEANEVIYPVDPNIRAKAAAEVKATHSDLPLMLTDPVASYINYFSTRGRGTLEHALIRSGRYQEMIQRILQQEGVPQDLIYLAQAESGFHPLALSRAGARGIWQFMALRAAGYGLERNMWVDERQDPEKATRAAAHHLRDLYNQFGDWYLAMAAYNSGPGTVQSAVKRTGYADFWELYRRNALPKETRNYVPIILAETIMAKNPGQYGLEDLVQDKPVPYDTVKVDYAVDLRLVAECVDAPPATLADLNPSLLRMVTPKGQEFSLRLPLGSKYQYLNAINEIPKDMRLWWRYHTVAPGDTLSSLARSYHTTPHAISQANSLTEGEALESESKLIIPVAPGKHPYGEGVQSYAKHVTVYKVRKGDTVQSVADNFGVSIAVVRRWNHLKGNSVSGRHVLYVHLPVNSSDSPVPAKSMGHKSLSARAATPVRHSVKPGETLYSIANSYNTTVAAIKENNRNVATLRPGMILLIPRNE
jgi:peptidoglycan lytic transglycosylase D